MTERPWTVADLRRYRQTGVEPGQSVTVDPTPAELKAAALARDEAALQAVVVKWLKYALRDDVRFTHVPLGGKRRKAEAARLIGQGCAPGWPDLTFAWADGPGEFAVTQWRQSRSAFIELKTSAGSLTAKQREFQTWCRDNGIPHAVCRSLKEVATAVRGWGITRLETEAR